MKIIDEQLLDAVTSEARQSPRLRMNYNFHKSLDEKCHRFLISHAAFFSQYFNVFNRVTCHLPALLSCRFIRHVHHITIKFACSEKQAKTS